MAPLRTLSARPTVIVDERTRPFGERAVSRDGGAVIGTPGPFGRNRVVSALPMNKSKTVILARPRLLAGDFLIGDPQGNVLGAANKIVVHRMLYATRTINTRRL